jgi:hypothetical protein
MIHNSTGFNIQGCYIWFGWYEISVFPKQLQIKTWNSLKTACKLMMLIWRCLICAHLVTLQMSVQYLNSSHIRHNRNSSTLAMACGIHSRSSWRDCDIRGWHNPINTAWSKVWGSREPRNGSCSSCPSLLHLRCHFPLTMIRMTFAADTLHQCC